MKNIIFGIIALYLLIGCRSVILPSADGTGPDPSPPTLIGTIIEISPKCLVVNSINKKAKISFPVEITKETYIFTNYGGFLTPEELKVGEKVRIWIKKSDRGRGNKPSKASAIEVEKQ